MSYASQIRHPSGALDTPKEKSGGGRLWWWLFVAVAAFVAIAIWRPAWLARIGIEANLSGAAKALGAASNPMEWV